MSQLRTLVLIGAGEQAYRSYSLEQISSTYRVILLDTQEQAWATPFTAQQVTVDLGDLDAVTTVVEKLATEEDIAGVLTYSELHTPIAAFAASRLGLPGPSATSVAECRDKLLTRCALDEAELGNAFSLHVDSEEEALTAAHRIGYPVVIKPRALGGSVAVKRADSDDDVRVAYRAAASATVFGLAGTVPGVLVEEYLSGPEISVEAAIVAPGDIHLVAVTRKQLGPEPSFEETGHSVDARDLLLAEPSIRELTRDALKAVGLAHTVAHVEMRLTPTGPRIIEINARLAEDLIPHLVKLATGVDLSLVAAALATGADVADLLVPAHEHAAAVHFFYSATGGILADRDTFLPDAAWMERFVWRKQPGDHIVAGDQATLTDRLALAVVTAPTAERAHSRLGRVRQRTHYSVTQAHHGADEPAARSTEKVGAGR